ncbi:hypothetical protein ACP70R_040869 [Stipagrostis hirtigluma subsp. patula]
MSLRALSSLLARRLAPRSFPRVPAQAASSPGIASAARKPSARSLLHAIRNLTIRDGALAVFAAGGAFAGLVGTTLYLKKDPDEPVPTVAREVAAKEPILVVNAQRASEEHVAAVMARFRKKDGTFDWSAYLDSASHGHSNARRPCHEEEDGAGKEAKREASGRIIPVRPEDVKDEAAMRARFEDWIKEYGKAYESEEEKAYRYEIFKATAVSADKSNAERKCVSGPPFGAPFGPTEFADWTEEEIKQQLCIRPDKIDWEDYVAVQEGLLNRLSKSGGGSVKQLINERTMRSPKDANTKEK